MQQTIYALLIGINHYASPTVPDLGGCVNDVTAMATTLQRHFHVPLANIQLLINEQATYDAVKLRFRQHLIEAARHSTKRANGQRVQPPAMLFHFSGHGSQAPEATGQEPDGFDETLVCHDSRLPDRYDLKDWELGALLDELAQYTDNITVILDCCHSGSGTRAESKVVTHTRSCYPDRRPQPTARALLSPAPGEHVKEQHPAQRNRQRVMTKHDNHVLLAACRDQEIAMEHISSPGAGVNSAGNQRHGVLTHYLIPLLEKIDPQQPPTYRELYEELRYAVTHDYAQLPQCEGDWGRLVFGEARPNRDLWLTVIDQRDGLYRVNGGLAHGFTQGVRFHVYRPRARTLGDAGESIGTLEAVEVGAIASSCRLVAATEVIPIHARLREVGGGTTERKKIALDIPNEAVTLAVRERLAQSDVAGLVALAAAESTTPLRFALVQDTLEIQNHEGTRISQRYPLRLLNSMRRPLRASDLEPIVEELQRIVRVQRLDLLQNGMSELDGTLAMTVRHLTDDPTTGKAMVGDVIATMPPLETTAEKMPLPTLRTGEPFVVELTNRADEPLYIGLLLRSGAWSVEQLYPTMRGAQQQLLPGHTVTIGLEESPVRQLSYHLGNTTPIETITLLLIGTVGATDFEVLLQNELSAAHSPQHAADQHPSTQRVVRSFQLGGPTSVDDEWTVLRLPMRVVTT